MRVKIVERKERGRSRQTQNSCFGGRPPPPLSSDAMGGWTDRMGVESTTSRARTRNKDKLSLSPRGKISRCSSCTRHVASKFSLRLFSYMGMAGLFPLTRCTRSSTLDTNAELGAGPSFGGKKLL